MKLNWGGKIALLYGGFVIAILCMVFYTMSQQVDLVSPDYYAKELDYQNHIDEMNNTVDLKEQPQITAEGEKVKIVFPQQFEKEKITGTLLLFCPSDATKDSKTDFSLDQNRTYEMPVPAGTKGYYKIQLSWVVNDHKYFNEQLVTF